MVTKLMKTLKMIHIKKNLKKKQKICVCLYTRVCEAEKYSKCSNKESASITTKQVNSFIYIYLFLTKMGSYVCLFIYIFTSLAVVWKLILFLYLPQLLHVPAAPQPPHLPTPLVLATA